MVAILVNGPRPFLQSFVPPTYGGSIYNLSKFDSVASEEKSSGILNNFPIQMLWGSKKCIGKQTWPCHKKVKCQRTTIFLATLEDLLSPMISAQIQPQGILGSGEEDF